MALITLDRKWGPGDVFVVEMEGSKLTRMTNLASKLHDLLLPKYRSARPKPEPYNDTSDFIFEEGEDPVFELDEARQVKINVTATTDPKGLSSGSGPCR